MKWPWGFTKPLKSPRGFVKLPLYIGFEEINEPLCGLMKPYTEGFCEVPTAFERLCTAPIAFIVLCKVPHNEGIVQNPYTGIE